MNFHALIPFVPYIAGLSVGALFLIAIAYRRRGTGADHFAPPPPTTRSSDWEIPQTSFGERRTSLRREGHAVKVLLSSPTFRKGVDSGYVVDRSTTGLRIAMGLAMAPGSTMQVRAHNAPDTIPWVTVVVRNCRNAGRHYEIGVEFDKPPPWNVLLLFG